MALIKCPECNASISDKALSCPQCGHPMATTGTGHSPIQDVQARGRNGNSMSMVAWMGIAVVILIFALFALISTCNWAPV